MAKKVTAKALQTLHGSYGLANSGDEITLDERHAKELAEKGLIEIIGEASDDAATEKEGSFNITDNTGKAKEKAEADTDKANPTGEKNAKAGPAAPKKSTKKK